jgi:hypothetical protein
MIPLTCPIRYSFLMGADGLVALALCVNDQLVALFFCFSLLRGVRFSFSCSGVFPMQRRQHLIEEYST